MAQVVSYIEGISLIKGLQQSYFQISKCIGIIEKENERKRLNLDDFIYFLHAERKKM